MLVRLAQGLGKRIIVGSLGLSKSSKKNFYTVSYFFFSLSTVRLSYWLVSKEKGGVRG